MAHQMSPPQRPAHRPFSPYQQQAAHSPPGIALPPAKRQRLSPGLGSPQLPSSAFPESPYGPFSASAGSPPPFNVPQPFSSSPPPAGVMGPPPRPTAEQKAAKEKEEKEKVTDISDISDAMWGSGVDLREEENYLSSTNRAFYGTQSFSQSFDSQSTIASPHNSFGQLKQEYPGSHFRGNGPASQVPTSLESVEAEIDRKHRDAALKYAREHEQHLRDPFLLGNSTRHRFHRIAVDQGVHLDVKGLYDPPRPQPPVPQQPQGVNGVVATGPNDVGLASIKAKSAPETQHAFLEQSARFADVLSLISLAANERMRTLLDEAFTLSRGRQTGSDGVVPPGLQDIANGIGKKEASVDAQSITNSSWDRPRKQSDTGDVATSQLTVSFTSGLPAHLSSLAISEHAAESARIKRRAERAAKAAAAQKTEGTDVDMKVETGTTPTTPAPGTPAPATPISNDSPASGALASDKPLTKKERERMAKAGQTEEVLHKNANVTAAMQLGFGKKAKKYSWMTGGSSALAAPTNPFAKSTPKPATPSSAGNSDSKKDRAGANGERKEKRGLGKERKFGSWREDGPDGRGIQLRDLVAVIERDGKHLKVLEKAYAGLDREGQRL